jgi:hypothetical protein
MHFLVAGVFGADPVVLCGVVVVRLNGMVMVARGAVVVVAFS